MKIIPITDFENDYAITDQGTVIDLSDNSIKIPYTIKMFNINQPAVDLYKNGEFVFTITIRELVVRAFFNLPISYRVKQINGDINDYSPYNLEIHPYEAKHRYVNSYNLTKPISVYGYSDNGVYVVNQDEIDDYIKVKNKISEENRKVSKENRVKIKSSQRKTPLPGTPEREAWAKERKLINKINAKLSYIKKIAEKLNEPFNLCANDIIDLYNTQNGICIATEEIIDLNKVYTIMPKIPELGYVPNNIDLIKTRRQRNIYNPRKLKPESEVRLKQIIFRVTENEFTEITYRAKNNNLGVSEFIRSEIL